MLTTSVSVPVTVASADALWREISDAAHEACVLRCSGRLREAKRLMEDCLPLMIRDWSQACGLPVPERKDRLRRLFAQVQERVASAVISRRLAEESLPSEERRSRVVGRPMQIIRHVPIDDVPGMLDALAEEERRWNPAAAKPLSKPTLVAA
jgi:hypothetical protein